ncbi:MAG: hypothetical protein DRI71_06660 [Bacteroidetes bacterium]|nr:MAG: hypothetical protein DRI71_06660 [Bacteroidota bacterium]
MDEYLDEKPSRKKTVNKREVVKIDLSDDWSYKDRMGWLIKGAQSSVDEIIKSLHQPMELETLRDISYKNATSGREEAIITTKNILMYIGELSKSLKKTTDSESGIEKQKDFEGGFAEQFASKKN